MTEEMKAENEEVTAYWMEFYATDHCSVCGNCGVIFSEGIRSPAGANVGRKNYCFCPNGQALRSTGISVEKYTS